jgi:hypothetical protein
LSVPVSCHCQEVPGRAQIPVVAGGGGGGGRGRRRGRAGVGGRAVVGGGVVPASDVPVAGIGHGGVVLSVVAIVHSPSWDASAELFVR